MTADAQRLPIAFAPEERAVALVRGPVVQNRGRGVAQNAKWISVEERAPKSLVFRVVVGDGCAVTRDTCALVLATVARAAGVLGLGALLVTTRQEEHGLHIQRSRMMLNDSRTRLL